MHKQDGTCCCLQKNTEIIHQEEVSIMNIYAPKIKAPTYVIEALLELIENKPLTQIGNFNISLNNGQVNQTKNLTEKKEN